LADSIYKANDQGKLKVTRIEDCTAENVEINVYLPAGSDADLTIKALYAFSDCEVSISPNACVIQDKTPKFLGVSEILRHNAKFTKDLLKQELEIELQELEDKWHYSSLEKIFIENRIYRRIEEAESWEEVLEEIWNGLESFLPLLNREVTDDDILRLTEIKIKKISKFNKFKADEQIKAIEKDIAKTKRNLRNLTKYTIKWYQDLKDTYGKNFPRRTELSTFNKVDAKAVVVANDTLYVNRKDGMAGWSMKRDEAVMKCSRMDDVIAFSRDGTMRVVKIQDKVFIGKDNLHCAVFKRDEQLFYNMVYRDGRGGRAMAKRFQVAGVTRDKLYDLTKGSPGTRVLWFSVHETEEEADMFVRIHLKPAPKLRNLVLDLRFADLEFKGRGAMGNIITKHSVDRVTRIPVAEQEALEKKAQRAIRKAEREANK